MTDSLTGLIWSRDANGTIGGKTWQEALTFANALTLCGYSDWRLTNKNELHSLIDYSKTAQSSPALSDGHPFVNVRSETHHTSNTSVLDTTKAVYVGMTNAGIGSWVKGTYAMYWPVRGGQAGGAVKLPRTGQTTCYDTSGSVKDCTGTGQDGHIKAGAAWPNPRFATTYCDASGPCASQSGDCDADNSNDIITDRLTGLVWTRDANKGAKTWQDALTYANGMSLCGKTDWRMPNLLELESLANAETDPKVWLGTYDFVNIQNNWYWTSTTRSYQPERASVLWFPDTSSWGHSNTMEKTWTAYTWPVRGGK